MKNPKERLDIGYKFHKDGNFETAEAIYRSVLEEYPAYAHAWLHFGILLSDIGRSEEALAAYDVSLQINPSNPAAWSNRGNTLGYLSQPEKAAASFVQSLKCDPDRAITHRNLGINLLRAGRFDEGWQEYDWRVNEPQSRFIPPECEAPIWRGEDLAGKSLIIHGEQGLGDEIFAFSAVSEMLELAETVYLTSHPALLSIISRSTHAPVVPRNGPFPETDYQVPAMSLLRWVRPSPTAATLKADDELRRNWQERTKDLSGFKVGFLWRGNPRNGMDRIRSIPLKTLLPAIDLPGVQLISLQLQFGLDELETLDPNKKIPRLLAEAAPEGELPIADETAALMSCLDLIISCDSFCAHLAGALGIETWLLLAKVPDWRWGLHGDSSDIYPKVKLYRQTKAAEWASVCTRVNRDLKAKLKTQQPHTPDRAPSSYSAVAQTPHGQVRYLKSDQYVGRSLELYGEFSEGEVDLFRQVIQEGAMVIEAGANIGSHTVALAHIVGQRGSIFAFEPQRLIFQILCGNIATNELINVFCFNNALGAEPGTINVPLLDPTADNNFGGLALGHYKRGEQVEVKTLDSLALSRCDFIKADVEGMESEVLRGASNLIEKFKPAMYIENDREKKSEELIELVRSMGYNMYWHKPRLFNPSNRLNNSENVFGNIVSKNMLCVHQSRPSRIEGLEEVD